MAKCFYLRLPKQLYQSRLTDRALRTRQVYWLDWGILEFKPLIGMLFHHSLIHSLPNSLMGYKGTRNESRKRRIFLYFSSRGIGIHRPNICIANPCSQVKAIQWLAYRFIGFSLGKSGTTLLDLNSGILCSSC
ncbi:hypothetical protein COLO4_34237 [Corchorus olitorius]|uniref:Uncharacterized protein n=1 Tax=Corchorus olitorius TaxID=93759 RepID=A0A1R3GMN2_9ROSI|nr:hypothetical protein COLO4_34237 [Corchorus olitorius]